MGGIVHLLRWIQLLFSALVLALTAATVAGTIKYANFHLSVDALALFVAAFSLLSLLGMIAIGLFAEGAVRLIQFILAIEIINTILWFAAFIALTVKHAKLKCQWTFSQGNILYVTPHPTLDYCKTGKADAAMAAITWALFMVTTVILLTNYIRLVKGDDPEDIDAGHKRAMDDHHVDPTTSAGTENDRPLDMPHGHLDPYEKAFPMDMSDPDYPHHQNLGPEDAGHLYPGEDGARTPVARSLHSVAGSHDDARSLKSSSSTHSILQASSRNGSSSNSIFGSRISRLSNHSRATISSRSNRSNQSNGSPSSGSASPGRIKSTILPSKRAMRGVSGLPKEPTNPLDDPNSGVTDPVNEPMPRQAFHEKLFTDRLLTPRQMSTAPSSTSLRPSTHSPALTLSASTAPSSPMSTNSFRVRDRLGSVSGSIRDRISSVNGSMSNFKDRFQSNSTPNLPDPFQETQGIPYDTTSRQELPRTHHY